MKKLLLVSCTVVVANFLHAQVTFAVPQLQTKPHGFKNEYNLTYTISTDTAKAYTFEYRLQNSSQQTQPTVDNMPVVGVAQVNLTLRGNNNQGFIVYSATPDNMPVIKPDATFKSTMPIVSGTQVNPSSKP